jgi:hypothetical protein
MLQARMTAVVRHDSTLPSGRTVSITPLRPIACDLGVGVGTLRLTGEAGWPTI